MHGTVSLQSDDDYLALKNLPYTVLYICNFSWFIHSQVKHTSVTGNYLLSYFMTVYILISVCMCMFHTAANTHLHGLVCECVATLQYVWQVSV